MEKVIISAVVGIITFSLGLIIGNKDTIDKSEHQRIVRNYQQDITVYQDYINALDKTLNVNLSDNPALEVLRSKLPGNE